MLNDRDTQVVQYIFEVLISLRNSRKGSQNQKLLYRTIPTLPWKDTLKVLGPSLWQIFPLLTNYNNRTLQKMI